MKDDPNMMRTAEITVDTGVAAEKMAMCLNARSETAPLRHTLIEGNMQLLDENTNTKRSGDLVKKNRTKNRLDHLHTSGRYTGPDGQSIK